MSQTDQTPGEITDSLTGHEEGWIADQFGKSIGQLAGEYIAHNDVGPYYRALIFILKRREGVVDDDARNAVLDMTLTDAISYFPSEKESDAEATAVEESGKGEPVTEQPREPSLSSVS